MRHARGLSRRELTPAIIARFGQKIHKTSTCWLWTASCFQSGYGQLALGRNAQGRQRVVYAHRVSYVLTHGDIPAGAILLHSCDTPACVNPAHLRLGNQRENLREAAARGRLAVTNPGSQKITDAQVREIRQSVESSVTLAKRYSVTLSCISVIRRGLRRKAA